MHGPDGSPDGTPLRVLRHFGTAVEQTIKLHEELCPARRQSAQQPTAQDPTDQDQPDQSPERAPISLEQRRLEAIPFDGYLIPDTSLAKMVEILDTEPDTDIQSLAARFDYPASLVERELPIYKARYRKWIESQAAAS